jgi:hypothetical protein
MLLRPRTAIHQFTVGLRRAPSSGTNASNGTGQFPGSLAARRFVVPSSLRSISGSRSGPDDAAPLRSLTGSSTASTGQTTHNCPGLVPSDIQPRHRSVGLTCAADRPRSCPPACVGSRSSRRHASFLVPGGLCGICGMGALRLIRPPGRVWRHRSAEYPPISCSFTRLAVTVAPRCPLPHVKLASGSTALRTSPAGSPDKSAVMIRRRWFVRSLQDSRSHYRVRSADGGA